MVQEFATENQALLNEVNANGSFLTAIICIAITVYAIRQLYIYCNKRFNS